MVCSALRFLRHLRLSPGEGASLRCEQRGPAAVVGAEDVTQSQQKVALHGGSGFPAGFWHLRTWQEFCSKSDLRLGTRS